jgi:cell division protein FtsN
MHMEKITKIKHNNSNSNRKNQTSVLMVAVLIAVAIAVVAGPTLVIIIQEAHATTCTTKITCTGTDKGVVCKATRICR